MYHAENLVLRGHDWAVAAWSILLVATVLGIASNQPSQLFSPDARLRADSITSAAKEMATVARLAVAPHDTFPAVLTVPFAVTRTQRMMVAGVKHGAEDARRTEQDRSGMKAVSGFLTGLTLLGAAPSSSH